jgi:hypothetical protein
MISLKSVNWFICSTKMERRHEGAGAPFDWMLFDNSKLI